MNKGNDSGMKADLVMWAKNGAKTLPRVLKRIDEVIPEENVVKKVFVDDHSVDNSIQIAKSFSWKVYENREGFISGGASEALKHVTSPFFISFEQDLLLARNWWQKVPEHMKHDPKVAVAQGMRFSTTRVLRCLEEYSSERFKATRFNLSLDNNILRTSVIKRIGGFPKQYPISVDLELFDILQKNGYRWVIDRNVISDHIRAGVLHEVLRSRKLMEMEKRQQWIDTSDVSKLVARLAFSPIRATHVMIKKRCPQIFFVYPFLRLLALRGFLDRKKLRRLGKLRATQRNMKKSSLSFSFMNLSSDESASSFPENLSF